LINILCDRALLASFAQGAHQVALPEVRAAAREIAADNGTARWHLAGKDLAMQRILDGAYTIWILGGIVAIEILLLIWFVQTGA
jgi:hypothetical protein